MKSSNLKSKMMLLGTTLVLSSTLVGCFGGEESGDKVDISEMRVKCEEASGFTGNAEFYPGGVFQYRKDGAEVAECSWHDGNFKYLGILGSSHPADSF